MARTDIPLSKITVPLPLAMGRFEKLTNKELDEHLNDILAEYKRRLGKVGEE